MSETISFGAGVNSVAMTIMLVSDGWEGPIVFADPGAEYPETYCYIDMFEHKWLEPRGLSITRLSPATHPQLYSPSYRMPLENRCLDYGIIPYISRRWCTIEYKRKPIHRHCETDIYLLGFSLEEAHRAERRQDDTIVCPLIDGMIDRDGCKDIIREAGLPLPRKSGCFYCPFQRRSEWRALYDVHPGLLQRAIDMEENARAKHPGQKVRLGVSLGVPLLIAQDRWGRQAALPEMPEIKYDYYQTCECGG